MPAPEEIVYFDLHDLLSFSLFDFTDYRKGEIEILQPQMEAMGYTEFEWSMGEYDSFGPLTRICRAINKDGTKMAFIYG